MRVFFRFLRMNIKSEGSFKVAFLSKILLMFLNNLILLGMWVLLFQSVGTIGDWGVFDMVALFGIISLSIGMADYFAMGSRNFCQLILSGKMDTYMIYPYPKLAYIVLSRNSILALGDIIFGLIMVGVSGLLGGLSILPLIGMLLRAAIFSLLGGLVFVSFNIILNSLVLYLGKIDQFIQSMSFSVVLFGTYPESIYPMLLRKTIFYTIIPVGLIVFLPLELTQSFNLKNFFILLGGVFLFLAAGTLLFYKGLSRYHSGNSFVTGE